MKYQRKLKMKNKKEELNGEDEDETLFIAGRFKGRCRNCGKFGHKASEGIGRKEKDNRNMNHSGIKNNFNGKCFLCGRYGYRKADCWYNRTNARAGTENRESENANNASEIEYLDEVSMICFEIFQNKIINKIQNQEHQEEHKQKQVDISNYYESFDVEEDTDDEDDEDYDNKEEIQDEDDEFYIDDLYYYSELCNM